jgi:hypothetical protein
MAGASLLRKALELWLTPQIVVLWPKRRILEVPLGSLERAISTRVTGVVRAFGWIWSIVYLLPLTMTFRRSNR